MREALASLPWVKDVQVNYNRKQSTFTVETERYDEAAIIRVLEEAGFGGTVRKR